MPIQGPDCVPFDSLSALTSGKAGSGDRPKGVPTLGDFAAARTPGTDSSAYDADYARRMPSELY